jgi:hypothetical protein
VASLVAKRAVDGRGIFMRDLFQAKFGAYIDFKEEVGSGPGQASSSKVLDIPYLADTAPPDVALMRITGHDLPSVLPPAEARERANGRLAIPSRRPHPSGATLREALSVTSMRS